MATITDLRLSPSVVESVWIRNITDTDATEGVDIVPAIEEYTHLIKSITISTNVPDKWIKILDGSDILIGPVSLAKGIPFEVVFTEPIYCTAGNAVVLQTEAASEIHIFLTGSTIPPPLVKANNPTPADNATGVSPSPALSWDSSPQVVSSKVYINGTLSGSTTNSSYAIGPLTSGTTYTWRADDNDGNSEVEGDAWTFTTGDNPIT